MITTDHKEIAVLALGNWGTALANHLAQKGFQVIGWSQDQELVNSINVNHRSTTSFQDIILNERFAATTDLERALKAQVVVLSFPSAALQELIPKLINHSDKLYISALKGLESNTLLTPIQFMLKTLGDDVKVGVLSGPSFAIDVIQGRPVGIVSAAREEAIARTIAELFSSSSMKVYLSTDSLGVELGGIVKNVVAIAVGVCDGLSFGDSARAGLITRGLAEMIRLAEALGAQTRTLSGLSGLGDLMMTASCDTSRNRTVGLRLGRGESLQQILFTLGSVAEGVETTPLLLKLAEKAGVEMPITNQVNKLLQGKGNVKDLALELLQRPMKREF